MSKIHHGINQERMEALLSGKSVDQIPFYNFLNSISAAAYGIDRAEFYSDVVKNFHAQVKGQESFGYAGYPLYWFSAQGHYWYGGEITMPTEDQQAPQNVGYIINSEEEAERFEPPDVKKMECIQKMIEFSRLQQKNGMKIVFNAGGIGGVVGLSDPMVSLKWVKKKPELVHRITRKTMEYSLDITRYFVDTFGAENLMPFVVQGGNMGGLFSVARFEEFIMPYWREFQEKVLEMGVPRFLYHVCGPVDPVLDQIATLPISRPGVIGLATCPNEVDLEKFVELFGDKAVVAGSVPPARIAVGERDEVYEFAKKSIEIGKNAPNGFMLSSACEIPPQSPPHNVFELYRAAEELGKY